MRLFIIYIFLSCVWGLSAQKNSYNVIFFGDSIGNIVVEKKELSENKYSYHFYSETNAEFLLFKIKTKAISDLVFENNLLKTAYVYRQKNKDIQEVTYNWNGIQYLVNDKDEDLIIDKEIYYCTANFFLRQPKDVFEVFVERFNYFVPIEHLGNNQYLTRVDGGTNLYTYENGILQSVKSKKGLTVYMELKE